MSRLALGTVQFGLDYGIANQEGQVDQIIANKILQVARVNNIDTLDTAIAYGESETCLGKIGTHDLKIVTKIPAFPKDCDQVYDWVQEQVNESLTRLGVDSVYGLLLHRSSQLLEKDGKTLFRSLQKLKATGQVQKIGVSICSPKELELLTPYFDFDLVQAPFNLLDRRLSSSGWLARLKDNNIEVHVRSVFLQGLLLMPAEEVPTKFSPWFELLTIFHKWLQQNNVSAIHACLSYPLSFPEIDRLVIGANSVTQLQEIIAATQSTVYLGFPDLNCEDERLINPANWPSL